MKSMLPPPFDAPPPTGKPGPSWQDHVQQWTAERRAWWVGFGFGALAGIAVAVGTLAVLLLLR